jgi:phenylpropionate dioxygenase-like ring-hydroxylating dioxygenase large terminal subunit
MLSTEHNDILTRVGPGTPTGELMREYWIPACLPGELKPDAAPTRIKLLGEKLIAFRDTEGRIGILDHRCPHRCASMFFGRNEEGGIRCAYHGWKFDVEGNCLDQPNLPEDQRFTDRVKAKAYKVAEKGGIVWVYMGKRQVPPPLPALEVLSIPDDERIVMCHMRDCNWLQSLEGDIDTSHFGFLHAGAVQPDDVDPNTMHRYGLLNRTPRYHVKETEWGTMYDAYRPADSGNHFHRFAHFMFPCFALVPDGTFSNMIQATLSVPLDDNHTMTYVCAWSKRDIALRTLKDGSPIPGAALTRDFLPTTTDWLGRWRLKANRDNDYLIDRDEQASGKSYSGIQGIGQQDQAMVESMEGAEDGIVDRGFENLAASDRMIAMTRRRIIAAAQAHQKDGTIPPTVDRPELARNARGGSFVCSDKVDWLDAYAEELRKAQSPAGFLLQAAE